MVIKDGRFGPYVTDGETNASLRRGDTVEGLTVERATELLAERRARGPADKPARKAPAKKAPARKASVATASARKTPAAKTSARKTPAAKTSVRKTAAAKAPARKAAAKKAPAPS
jgi:DNA topoisomerase-1